MLPSFSTDHGPVSHLIARLAHLHRAVATTLLNELGLRPGQELLLMELWDRDGQSQIELGKSLHMDPSTMTAKVKSLEQLGLITRHPCAADRRVTLVFLTPSGSALRARLSTMWAELEARTTAGMSEAEYAETLRALKLMVTNLVDTV